MAKINRFIASYSDAIADLELSADETLPPKAVIHRFVRVFKNIDDSRCEGMISYPRQYWAMLPRGLRWRNLAVPKRIGSKNS